eukprot:GFUD01019047.1.p1 GENE.GFUD01019047.1~~GFUD01019047.1.p1  ORF type:complete len:399 (+),score=82.24 GFUD01019047.1:185-1381(+)
MDETWDEKTLGHTITDIDKNTMNKTEDIKKEETPEIMDKDGVFEHHTNDFLKDEKYSETNIFVGLSMVDMDTNRTINPDEVAETVDQVQKIELIKEEVDEDCPLTNNKEKQQRRQGQLKNKKCPYCEKLFRDSAKLKYHIYTHTKEKPFTCDVCQQSFNHPSHFKRHMSQHQEKNIACHHCPKMFSDQKLLNVHLKHVDQSFTCNVCGIVYASKDALKNHQRKHTGETPYSCSHCESKFDMSYKLKNHVNTKHLNVPKQLFVCELCGKEYKKRSDMNEHANTHSGEAAFKCETCNQIFNTSTSYREHKNMHNKTHECKECGKCFGNSRNLVRHEKMHNGIKDFQCANCAKQYSSMISLQKHMEIKHDVSNGKKQTFSCDKCDKSYTRDEYLQRHMSIH